MNWQDFWAQRRSAIFSGIAALIIIGLGFLAFNTLSQSSDTTSKKETKKTATQSAPKKDEKKTETKSQTTTTTTKTHVVAKGESLSMIAQQYYNDGNKWTVLASANKIANPSLIYQGMNLTVPDVTASTPAVAGTTATKAVNQPKTYTVVKGDSLWKISQTVYDGNGYHWVLIRNANPGKVALLPNGRPLITPGTVLTIPTLPST